MHNGQGCDVVLQSLSFRTPATCASCGAAQQTTRATSKMKSYGNRRVTRTFQVPYCNACATRAKAFGQKGILFALVAFGIASVFALLPLVVGAIPLVVVVGLAVVVTLGFGIAAMTALAPKRPPLPATTAGDAVTLVNFNNDSSTLHCTNPAWGEEFARANGVQARPNKRGTGFGVGALLTGLIVGPAGAIFLWMAAHPSVYIDNPGADALQIWVDGKQSIVVPSNASGAVPPTIEVAHGAHTFGYSKVGASSPTGTVDAKVTMNDAHLYSPGNVGCYWLIADAYGSASVDGVKQGPQALKEFYSFDKVDTWFGDNPQSITVDQHSSGGTRVALQRAKSCMQLAEHGCSLDIRKSYVTCQMGAKDEAGFDACDDAAIAACKGVAPPPKKAPPPSSVDNDIATAKALAGAKPVAPAQVAPTAKAPAKPTPAPTTRKK